MLDHLEVPISTYAHLFAAFEGLIASSGPSELHSVASSAFKRRTLLSLDRVDNNVSYDGLISVDVDLQGASALAGWNAIHDDCPRSNVGTGNLRLYWKNIIRSKETGAGEYVLDSVKQGFAVVTTDGVVTSRHGWFASPQTSVSGYGGECGGLGLLIFEQPNSNFTVNIDGEPISIEIVQELRYIPSMLDARLRLKPSCTRSAISMNLERFVLLIMICLFH